MKLFFEEYPYPAEVLGSYGVPSHYRVKLKNGFECLPYVGYFFSAEKNDTFFILPKVFIIHDEKTGKDLAFQVYDPIEIIDTRDDGNPLQRGRETELVFDLSTWLYRAITRYKERNLDTTTVELAAIQNVVSVNGENSQTFLDIILALIRFHNEHHSLLVFISKLHNRGDQRIDWGRTVRRIPPVFQDGDPFYVRFVNRTRTVDFDEELIVLFYSVLGYLHHTFNFKTEWDLRYKILPPQQVEQLIVSQRGTRILRKIRKKYFTDVFVALWRLLYTFFERAEKVANKSYHDETLMVKNFNLVFEDMIDQMLSDDTKKKHSELKDQPDGKIVDHIYLDRSLIDASNIYFIGDSKYYKDRSDLGENSIFKQFTYAKNAIQINMDVFNNKERFLDPDTRYRDELTEGYNPSPNFFIRGVVDPDDMRGSTSGLEDQEGVYRPSCQFKNRFFDRDTLITQEYNINFLYVLSSYVLRGEDAHSKQKIHDQFRKNMEKAYNAHYEFFVLIPRDGKTAEEAFNKLNFKRVIGKLFCPYEENKYLILALDKNCKDQNAAVRTYLDTYFHQVPYVLGKDGSDEVYEGWVKDAASVEATAE